MIRSRITNRVACEIPHKGARSHTETTDIYRVLGFVAAEEDAPVSRASVSARLQPRVQSRLDFSCIAGNSLVLVFLRRFVGRFVIADSF